MKKFIVTILTLAVMPFSVFASSGNYGTKMQGQGCEDMIDYARYEVSQSGITESYSYWYLAFFQGTVGNSVARGLTLVDTGTLSAGSNYLASPDGTYGNYICNDGVINRSGFPAPNSSEDFFVVLFGSTGNPQTFSFIDYFEDYSASLPHSNYGLRIIDSSGLDVDNYQGSETRIIDFNPANGSTTVSNTVNFDVSVWVNPDDLGYIEGINLDLLAEDYSTFYGDNSHNFLVDFPLSSGYFSYASTTYLPDGRYAVRANIKRSYFYYLTNPLAEVSDYQIHYFTVVNGTLTGDYIANNINDWNFYNTGATTSISSTTINGVSYCTSWSNLDVLGCVGYMMIPDVAFLFDTVRTDFYLIKTRFPFGYINDFVVRLSSTTPVVDIPVFTATIPTSIVAGNPSITIDFNHSLDFLYNATTSQFASTQASTTATTFLAYTQYYWRVMLGFLALLYIIRRLLPFGRGEYENYRIRKMVKRGGGIEI